MKKWTKWYVLLMVVLVFLYLLAEYNRPRTIDWTPTYSNTDKIPYGTLLVYREIRHFFAQQAPKELMRPIYEHVNNSEAEGELYILVNQEINSTPTDEDELYKYIERGNTVLIGTAGLSGSFEKKFKVHIDQFKELMGKGEDSISINLVNPALRSARPYALQKGLLEPYFDRLDTSNTTIVGTNNHGDANFVRLKIGKGALYLHSLPQVFTNFFVLKDNNIEYIDRVFSCLPEQPAAIFWDEYYKLSEEGDQTPLEVILTRPSLRWAYYLALAGMVIFVVFKVKRRQRIIPVMLPPKNDSREFVETVSRVYFNQKHHLNIANKKIGYWLEFVRQHLGIPTRDLNEDFVQNLHHRSGASRDEIEDLIHWVDLCRVRPAISPEELLKINQAIDNFYKKAK